MRVLVQMMEEQGTGDRCVLALALHCTPLAERRGTAESQSSTQTAAVQVG